MNNDRRIITPQEFANRQDRRASMKEHNAMLASRIRELSDLNSRQAANIRAMNKVFSDIATTVGIPIPTTQEEGVSALARMQARIGKLVELEKSVSQKKEDDHADLSHAGS